MVKNIPLTFYAADRAVIISAGAINAVVNDVSAVYERASRRVGGRVCKSAADAGRVNHIIFSVDLSRRAGFKKALFLRNVLCVVDHRALVTARLDFVHIRGVKFVHIRLGKSVVDIDFSVIIYQHASIVKNTIIAHFCIIFIVGKQFKRAFRTV